MQDLSIKDSVYKYPKLTFIGVAMFAALICMMAIRSEHIMSPLYLLAMGGACFVAMLLNLNAFCNCLFMVIPFTSVLKLPVEVISFVSLMQMLFVLRAIVSRYISLKGLGGVVLVCIITQIPAVILFQQSVPNILLFIINVLSFYGLYKMSESRAVKITHIFLSFAIGVLLAGLVSLTYNISVAEHPDIRFCGLWSDPNFWGMFCMIGILACLIISMENKRNLIFMAPIIILLASQGFLTLSRTFVVMGGIMSIVVLWKQIRGSFWGTLFLIVVLAVGLYYAYPYAEHVFTERGIEEDDISNGRFQSSIRYLQFFEDNLEALLCGVGFTNRYIMGVYDVGKLATHNTYVDILVDFGLIITVGGLLWLMINNKIIKAVFKNIYSLTGIIFMVLCIYMFSLSMLKYSFLYLFFGLCIGDAMYHYRLKERKNGK